MNMYFKLNHMKHGYINKIVDVLNMRQNVKYDNH